MFNHTVKYLGFLKHVPVLPHVFDAYLKTVSYFNRSGIAEVIDEIEAEVLMWENTDVQLHKYGGLQFNVKGKEIGHVHGNGLLDVLFTKEIKEKLISKNKAGEHHVFKNSGWISYQIKSREEKEHAIFLLQLAYERLSRKHTQHTSS
jgi:hypothetical protein